MANIKITIDTGTKKYISVSVPGHGGTPDDYNVSSAMISKNDPTHFPSFNGTQTQWNAILEISSVKIENIGNA